MANLLSGKKTYITVCAGIAFNVANRFGWLPEGMQGEQFEEFVNWIFAFAAIAFLKMGQKKT